MTKPTLNTLLIQSSAQGASSVTRRLASRVAERIGGDLVTRELADGITLLNTGWVQANATEATSRSEAQKAELAFSDELLAELRAADQLVIAVPVYNFAIPSSLKAWIDQVARARETFIYTEKGPEGLLKGKKAWIVLASAGVTVGGPIDFVTPYLRFVLGFLGITDIEVIAAEAQAVHGDAAIAAAHAQIDAIGGLALAA